MKLNQFYLKEFDQLMQFELLHLHCYLFKEIKGWEEKEELIIWRIKPEEERYWRIFTQSTTVTTPSSFKVLSAPSSAHNEAIIGPGFATPKKK